MRLGDRALKWQVKFKVNKSKALHIRKINLENNDLRADHFHPATRF